LTSIEVHKIENNFFLIPKLKMHADPDILRQANPNLFSSLVKEIKHEVISDEELNEVIRNILFLTHHQRKLKYCPLIKVDQFCGNYPSFDLSNNKNILIAREARSNITILNTEEAKKLLKHRSFSFIDMLSFNEYRLAGGAPLNAIITSEQPSNDLDFFPVVGEYDGKDWKDYKITKAKEIYKRFYNEVRLIYEKHLKDTFDVLIWENENCTTFSFYLRRGDNRYRNYDDYINNIHHIKLSFIHRAYDTEDQILKGFDFPCSQVLYDGNDFKCSPAAMLSIIYSVLPVDVSSASDSFYSRLLKYNVEKAFPLAFPGLDRNKLNKTAEMFFNESKNSKFYYHKFPRGALLNLSKSASQRVYFSLDTIGNQIHKGFDNLSSLNQESDYGDCGQYVFAHREGFNYYGMKQFLLNKSIYKRAYSFEQFERNPEFVDFEKALKNFCSFDKSHSPFEIGKIFSEIFSETEQANAILFYSKGQKEEFNNLLEKATPLLCKNFNEALENNKNIGSCWLVDEPGTQTRRSFKPVELTPRGFYGDYYNGYHCTMDWPARCQIVIAWKKKNVENQTPFALLDKNLLKHIFFMLDLLCFIEYLKIYPINIKVLQDLAKDRKLPQPNPVYFLDNFEETFEKSLEVDEDF